VPLAVELIDLRACECFFFVIFVVCVWGGKKHACMRALCVRPVVAAEGSSLYITIISSLICVCDVCRKEGRKARKEGGREERKGAGMFGFILLLER